MIPVRLRISVPVLGLPWNRICTAMFVSFALEQTCWGGARFDHIASHPFQCFLYRGIKPGVLTAWSQREKILIALDEFLLRRYNWLSVVEKVLDASDLTG